MANFLPKAMPAEQPPGLRWEKQRSQFSWILTNCLQTFLVRTFEWCRQTHSVLFPSAKTIFAHKRILGATLSLLRNTSDVGVPACARQREIAAAPAGVRHICTAWPLACKPRRHTQGLQRIRSAFDFVGAAAEASVHRAPDLVHDRSRYCFTDKNAEKRDIFRATPAVSNARIRADDEWRV